MAAVCLVLATVILFELSYASYLPRYTINTFTVDGAQTLPTNLLARYIDTQLNTGARPFFAPNNIFLYNPKRLEDGIVGFFPRIKSVHVSRSSLFATAVIVAIQERQEFALWCAGGGLTSSTSSCYRMDDSGFIFAQADTHGLATTTQRYFFSGGLATSSDPIGRSFAPGRLAGVLALFAQIGQAHFTPTGAIVDGNGEDFIVPLKEGFDIKVSFGQDAESVVRNLELILSSDVLQGRQNNIQYIDLRFGDRAYYKLKSASATVTSTLQ